METKDACNILSTELEEMQVLRKISPASIDIINAVIEECKNREEFWLSNVEIPPSTAFVLYHASRNIRIIFDKMHSRFIQASKHHANPKVVDDAAIIFPELFEMCSLLDSIKKSKVTPEMLGFIKKRVRTLRNTAEKASMLPTVEEEVKSIDKNELAQQLEDLATDLRVNLV